MFYSIDILPNIEYTNGGKRVTYNIKDTCFSQEITILKPLNLRSSEVKPVALFQVYLQRNLYVARNLACYYLTLPDGYKRIMTDAHNFHRYFPRLNYAKYMKVIQLHYNDLIRSIQAVKSPFLYDGRDNLAERS